VEVDIVELSDTDMAMQGLAENLPRQGLNDLEKADGIKNLIAQLEGQGSAHDDAMAQVGKMLGYTPRYITQLIAVANYDPQARNQIRENKVTARTAMVAHSIGGDRMVVTQLAGIEWWSPLARSNSNGRCLNESSVRFRPSLTKISARRPAPA
jgi:hypothetical protein